MKKTYLTIGATALSALLISCGSSVIEQTTPPGATQVKTLNARQATVVTLKNRCPRADRPDGGSPTGVFEANAAASLIPIAVDFAVSSVTDYLKRLATERTESWIATGFGPIPRKGEPGCLIIMRGRIGSSKVAALEPQGTLSADDMALVGLVSPPDFYMEAHLYTTPRPKLPNSPAGGADIVLRPQFVQFARTAARRGTDEAKEIGIILVMRSTPLPRALTEEAATSGADAVFPLYLGALRPGQEIRPAVFPVPRPSSNESPGAAHPFADLVQGGSLSRYDGTLNLAAFVTESGEPGRVLALINGVLERRGKALTDSLSEAIQEAVKSAINSPKQTN